MSIFDKIFFKLFVSIILISIPPVLIVGYLGFSYFSKTINKELNKHAETVMEQKLTSLNVFFNDLQRMEQIISMSTSFSEFFKADNQMYYKYFLELDKFMKGLQTIRPENIGITVVNEKGLAYFYSYSLNVEASNFVDYEWMPDFSKIKNTPFITSPHFRHYALREDKVLVFSYVQRFWNITSNTQGIIIIDFPLEVLAQFLGDNTNQDDSGTFIIDQNGNIIYPQNSTMLSNSYSQLYPKKMDKVTLSDGKTYRMFYQENPISGWTIVSYFSQKSLSTDILEYRNVLFIIMLIITAACLLATLFISFRIAHPIMNLVQTMKKVTKGDLNQNVIVKQRDEIGQLGIGFNRMIRHIQNLIEQVYVQEKEKRAVEIAALQAQIKPHFLYNALESINSLARNNKQPEISKQIVLLGKLLRFSVSTFKDYVPLEQEIKYVEHYMLINKLRMKENEFDFTIQFDENLSQLYSIKWILQPIVENAVLHGLEPAGRKGFIKIVGNTSDDDILITIEDNGAGIPPDKLEEIRFQLEHQSETLTKYNNKVGLYNVQARIRMHFGIKYGISIEDSSPRGTIVKLLIPRRASTHD
ncbi:sensor histidine kinase [Cohnella cellulosilytica]|uniref:histidine kinase n=1 Tax=Cohnella cellulosilytica TaxID=986710 RepID=A0ABW2F9X5_9BACL